jgi:outer membrane protein assembly factor BamB
VIVAGDWPEWRGPSRDGTSRETGLPTKWTPAGENLVWKQPYGGRSAPIIMGGRVFVFNSAGEGVTMQERVMALDANTGKLLWEHRMNVYESDVPHVASPVIAGRRPSTGNIYVFGAATNSLRSPMTARCCGVAR